MATVSPFSALVYDFDKAGSPGSLCCPPYDIIPDASVWRDKSPYNAVRLEKPEGDDPYSGAAGLLADWKARGILRRTPAAYYLYEIAFQDGAERKTVSGLFARLELTPYSAGEVLPHENTLSKAKEDRYRLMTATRCHTSPIYCLYHDGRHTVLTVTGRYKAEPPAVEFTDGEGLTHRLWVVDDPGDCEAIRRSFQERRLYIADGHHRYETALRVRGELGAAASPDGFVFLVDMSHPGLVVYPTHRIVTGLAGYDEQKTLARLAGSFRVEEGGAPGRNTVVMAGRETMYRLIYKDDAFDGLDVTLLHDHILEPVLGVGAANMAAGTNLRYTRDADEAVRAVREGGAQCAFLINATRVDQIRAVADAGGRMPQKSTYFYPKLTTGLIMNEFGV
ncbi:MAG: DUF1015 domain-containing protein [Oscillospiraceae bacterium]|nr:DUF1015 domain-containing protein [Oscillospiraceae bacterium]